MPKTSRLVNFVRRTTTSRGTRKIRARVREFGRFTEVLTHDKSQGKTHKAQTWGLAPVPSAFCLVMIVGCHESHPARRGPGHAPAAAHAAYTEAHRADLRPAVSPLSDRPAAAGAGDRRNRP